MCILSWRAREQPPKERPLAILELSPTLSLVQSELVSWCSHKIWLCSCVFRWLLLTLQV